MASLVAFLQALLEEGEVTLGDRPQRGTKVDRAAQDYLAASFAEARLEIAGPLLEFDAETALRAAEYLWVACWYVVRRDEPEEMVAVELAPLPAPRTAAEHLSADLVLRYLPDVHRRAQAFAPGDRLTALLAEELRRWPLSGVLSSVADAPLTSLDFDGHPGLQLLYAERLARNEKPAWLPRGRGFEYVELVFSELGKERSALLLQQSRQPRSEEEADAP